MFRPSAATRLRPPALLRALLLAAALLAPTACRTGSGGTPDAATPAAEVAGTLAIEAQTATPPAAGEAGLQTAAPVPTRVLTGTAEVRPTSEAAAEATSEMATREAERLPRFARTIGVAGTEPGQIYLPFDVAVAADGSLYVADSTGVQKLDAEGGFLERLGAGSLPMAEGLALGPDGRLFVAGHGALIAVFGPDGAAAGSIGQAGEAPGQLRKPTDVAVDAQGRIYVADAGNRRVEVFDPDGSHRLTIGGPGEQSGQFSSPRSIALDAAGRIYVGMGDDFLVQRFAPDGTYIDSFGQSGLEETLYRTSGLALDAAGRAYVAQAVSQEVQAFDTQAEPVAYLGRLGGRAGRGRQQFNAPAGMTIAGGELYIADSRNHRILVYTLP